MSCNTFISQCSCENSIIDLLAPESGNYTLYFFLRSSNRMRNFDVTVAEGDPFILPLELNPFSIYELTIKQGSTIIEIDGYSIFYLKTMICEDGETGTVTTQPNSFSYVLADQTGSTIDLTGIEVDTDSGTITINEALFETYDMYIFRNGNLMYSPFHYTFDTATQVITFVSALESDAIILQFIKKT